MRRTVNDVIAAVVILATIVLAAGIVAAPVSAASAETWPWYVWLLVSPPLYVCWLLVFLLLSAGACRQLGRRHPKPRYAVIGPGAKPPADELLGMLTVAMCYRRLSLLQSLPLASFVSQVHPLDRLVLRSYSPSAHIGRRVTNWGGLYDPDLTEVGDDVVLGAQSAIAAHTMAARSDGALVYVTAPVRIEDRATIGGEARVALGCVVGHDAIVEPGAVVEPFTQIPPGEVWGGNPARFRRTRKDIPAAPRTHRTAPPRSAPTHDEIRRLVIDALALPPDQATGDLSADSCALWDSLGQVAIAAAVFDRYGAAVDGADIFRLRSVDDIAAAIAGRGDTDARDPEEQLPDDVELLPLLGAREATRVLAEGLVDTGGAATAVHVEIVASFTAQPLEPTLRLWGKAFGIDVACDFAPYDQVVQSLLGRAPAPVARGERVTIVLARPDDLAHGDPATAAEEILDAVEHAAAAPSPGRLVVGTLPPAVSSLATIESQLYDELRHRWRSRLAATAGIEVFDFSRLVERLGAERARSTASEVALRSGYSQRLHQELAIALVRHIRQPLGPRAKVIALDCDNTLWGGIVGEAGLDGIELGPDGPGRSFQLFQRHLKRLEDRGLLLVVVSRNEEADVRRVFERHPGMVLKSDDIAAWRVGWRHKSESLRELAEELNVGLDSFVFLDDDPVARLEVKSRTPAVHVVPLAADPATFCDTLDRLWLFDGSDATSVDATRTQKAHEEARRRSERDTAASLQAFLDRLELEVEVRQAEDADVPRIAQLTQRTNQFNLSLTRRSVDEVAALVAAGKVLVLGASDRFGDYGQVGVCVLDADGEPGVATVDTLLVSCRALGRGVEDAFLHEIASAAADAGGTSLVAPFRAGPRNAQVKAFLARSGFVEAVPDGWTLSLASLPPVPPHVRLREAASSRK